MLKDLCLATYGGYGACIALAGHTGPNHYDAFGYSWPQDDATVSARVPMFTDPADPHYIGDHPKLGHVLSLVPRAGDGWNRYLTMAAARTAYAGESGTWSADDVPASAHQAMLRSLIRSHAGDPNYTRDLVNLARSRHVGPGHFRYSLMALARMFATAEEI